MKEKCERVSCMRLAQGAGLEWKEGSESLRLNTDPELAARISGDRIAAYNCDFCRKIIVSYEY